MPLNPTALRNMVAGWLTDTCTIREPGPLPEFDPATGYPEPELGDEVYDGECRLRPAGGDRVVFVGDGQVTLRLFDLTIPWDATGLEVNHLVTMNTSDDPMLEGRVYRVVDVQGGTNTAYRRLVVEDTLEQATGS